MKTGSIHINEEKKVGKTIKKIKCMITWDIDIYWTKIPRGTTFSELLYNYTQEDGQTDLGIRWNMRQIFKEYWLIKLASLAMCGACRFFDSSQIALILGENVRFLIFLFHVYSLYPNYVLHCFLWVAITAKA